MSTVGSTARRRLSLRRLVSIYLWLNVRKVLAFPANLITYTLTTALDNSVWLGFWVLFYGRFRPGDGWTVEDVVLLWAVVSAGSGLCRGFLGNASRLSTLIANGSLDTYLAQPGKVLPHILVSHLNLSALGDMLFGLVTFVALGHPTPYRAFFFLVALLLTAGVFLGFQLLIHSLSFWMGRADVIAHQFMLALIHFSTYPSSIFSGWLKVLLFTLIPAGYMHVLTVDVLHHHRWDVLLWVLGATLLLNVLGVTAFYRGLRRYESGSAIRMHGS